MVGHRQFSSRTALAICTLLATGFGRIISFQPGSKALQLASRSFGPSIYVASTELNGTVRAAQDLAIDFGRVTGQNGTLVQTDRVEASNSSTSPTIIVGTIGNSKLVDDLIASGKIDASGIKGTWESYIQATVDDPVEGVSQALVIAGSDMRGSIYGLYDVSETIGVLPYHFWADIPFKQKDAIFALPTSRVQESPSVKYRGIFINDEESGLMIWANARFPKSSYGCPFTHTFYQHVFELILRLKGNFLWPGMKKECGFYADDPLNRAEATRYGIFVGTSHHEPMATSYSEQKRSVDPFDWLQNLANVQSFFEMGVKRAKNLSTMWTLGMRGDGDTENEAYTADTIEEIIKWQQNLLQNETEKKLSEIPQSWVLYKACSRLIWALHQGCVLTADKGGWQILGGGHECVRRGHFGMDRRQLRQPEPCASWR